MLTRYLILICVATACILTSSGQATAHRKGPDGLEGWLVLNTVETLEHQGPLPTEMVITQRGRVLLHLCDGCSGATQKRDSGPFFWNLIFLPDGKRFAYQSGSLHFNMACILSDLRTGKRLGYVDCRGTSTEHQPGWVTALQNAPKLQ